MNQKSTTLHQSPRSRKIWTTCTSLLLIVILVQFSILNANAQAIAITGIVKDASGGTLPGVGVKIKNSGTSTVTDVNGRYSINVPNAQSILVFTYLGSDAQEKIVGSETVINVTLKDSQTALDEVVVVGYGNQRKSDVTGSIVSIKEQAIKDVPSANLAQALQGQGAGIDIVKSGGNNTPGATPQIRIRGSRSLEAGNSPLFVVDGIPFNGNINDLNQDDISSIEVLKDASSTAIYGSRGANGVVLVTTKRGKTGKSVISYSAYAGVTENLDKYDIMNAEQYALYKKWGRINANPGMYTGLEDPKFLSDLDNTFSADEEESLKSGRTTDWQNMIYKRGLSTNHQISANGGSEVTQYSLSGGYFNEKGIYRGQAFERYSLKATIDQQLGKFVRIGLSSINSLTYRNGENANNLQDALRASPLGAVHDDAGKLIGPIAGDTQIYNPLADFVDGASEETRTRLGTFNSLFMEASLLDGLKYRVNAGAEIRADTYGNFYGSATTNNMGGASTANNSNGYNYSYTVENLLLYEKIFKEKHKFNFTGLFSLQEDVSKSTSFDYDNILADYLQYYNPEYGANLTGEGNYAKWNILSYMGRVNYNFNDKYLLTLTMRADGSSRLAKGNKWDIFPSAAVAWNISNEPFLKSLPNISNLKLRFSYGKVGNTSIDPYATLGLLSPLTYNYGPNTNVTGVYPTSVPNPELKWESTTTYNAGIDFGFFDNRLSGTIEVYGQLTKDLLLGQSLPMTSGIGNDFFTNVGATKNRGVDFNLSTINFSGKDRNKFKWTTDLNLSINRGEITSLANGITRDIENNWFVGHPDGVRYDYQKIGIWQNTQEDIALANRLGLTTTGKSSVIGTIKVADLNNDNKITADDRTIIESNQPDWQGGITNRFGYKGFDFTVVAFARFGGTIESELHQSGSFISTFQGRYNNINVPYWTPDNPTNDYPKVDYNSTNPAYSSTLSYFDGSFLKIRSLSLGYNLAPSLINRIGAQSLRVYATARDPFILFSPYRNKYNGIDPETNDRVDVETPATWSMTFGINLTL